MAIGIVWFLVGLLWWGAILVGAFGVYSCYPRGRRAGRVVVCFASATVVVASTALLPSVGAGVWVPIFFVLSLPVVALRSVFGGWASPVTHYDSLPPER